MALNAGKFVQGRRKSVNVTKDRVLSILSYVFDCYKELTKDSPKYSKSWVKTKTKYHFEDYLKMKLVDDYLIHNKSKLSGVVSELEEINFLYENVKPYVDVNDGIEKSDKIDIYINKLGLNSSWGMLPDEHIYFVIECKRITNISDCTDYVDDIQKFCDRKYLHSRLPFESQIAFVEDKKLTKTSIVDKVNEKLKSKKATIKTKQFVKKYKSTKLYYSIHERNFLNNEPFMDFHILLDYYTFVVP